MTALSSTTRSLARGADSLALPVQPLQLHELSVGSLVCAISPAGAGFLRYGACHVTRQASAAHGEPLGCYTFVRDRTTGQFWSTTILPTLVGGAAESFQVHDDTAIYSRTIDEIVHRTTVLLVPDLHAEVRHIRLTNESSRPRQLEVTTYAEVVIGRGAADRAHPAFAKLFLETQFDRAHEALFAARRPRDPSDPNICAAHICLATDSDNWHAEIEYETDRARFIGRGRSLANPRALVGNGPLSRNVGAVLDPIFSLRRVVDLGPGETAEIAFAIVAADDHSALREQIAQLRNRPVATVQDESPAQQPADSAGPLRIDAAGATLNSHSAAVTVEKHNNSTSDGLLRADRAHQSERFANGLGDFSADGKEYVLRLASGADGSLQLPPMPWCNVVANEQAGFIVSERGAGCTWVGNSRTNRLTPWSNDPVTDPHSEALYLRDDETGRCWSPVPGPLPDTGEYEVRHGWGYSQFTHQTDQLRQQTTMFVPRREPVKVTVVELTNLGERPRHVTFTNFLRWELGKADDTNERPIEMQLADGGATCFATNGRHSDFSHHVAFAAAVTSETGCQQAGCATGAADFLGPAKSHVAPRAVIHPERWPATTNTPAADPCAACRLGFTLAPGESRTITLLLGEADSQAAAEAILAPYHQPEHAGQQLAQVRKFWNNLTGAVQIETPSPALNHLVNGWLVYQNLSCRMWGRSSFYQAGGAYGFRDQLQDAAALMHHDPQLTRAQILLHAANQFAEGDVLHWWHPPASRGLRTRFADDLLWLPLIATDYAATTGDDAIWDEAARYLTARDLEPGEQEVLLKPTDSGTNGSIYEHCSRAIDRALDRCGAIGLPLIGCGDWNDGMNRVGVNGKGESVWMGFFLYRILDQFVPVCRGRHDEQRADRYEQRCRELQQVLIDVGWDGRWFRRAFYDDGTPLGSADNDECQIDALVQAWSVISGAVPRARAETAMGEALERLVDRDAGLIQLLYPPFDKTSRDPGYIKGYLPGIRENGGQYTHGVLWFVQALAELGAGSQAVELLEMLCPANHARTRGEVATYQTEPYVMAADVYGVAPHKGRGGWSWYTGSAGWMWRVTVESVLGIGVERGELLVINPRIDANWPSCRVKYRLNDGATVYEVTIENPHGREQGVQSATCDEGAVEVSDGAARVPLIRDGSTHHVVVRL